MRDKILNIHELIEKKNMDEVKIRDIRVRGPC